MMTFFHEDYRFGAKVELSQRMMGQLADCFHTPDLNSNQVLGGRCSASTIHLDSIGPVIVKTYRRGGLLARFIEKTYFGIGKTRSQREFEQMEGALKLGVQTPEPVAFAVKGRLFYQNWLISREIPSTQSIAQLSRTEPDRAETALQSLGRQVAILLDHGTLHADFHPGNVLVDDSDKVYLIDFDKAAAYDGGRKALRLRYRQRWCRAVEKHHLPTLLSKNIGTWLV